MDDIRRGMNRIDTASIHLIILVPLFFVYMFINAAIYQAIHNTCEANEGYGGSYFEALQYLQTVAFTIGYGHITPICHGGRIYTFFFAYITIPMVMYTLTLSGRKIADLLSSVGSTLLKGFKNQLLIDLLIIFLLDFFILIVMIIIPAALVPKSEGNPTYGDNLWYVFSTVTTIGFGDVIAAMHDESNSPNAHHINNFYWVAKMGFLMVSLSFIVSSLMLKYQMVMDHIYGPVPSKSARKKLFDDISAHDGIEAVGIATT